MLLLTPFSTLGLQNYGGEIACGTYFFLLPGACILIAYLFFPEPVAARLPLRARAAVPAAVVALVLVFGFLLVRFGNERFEQVQAGRGGGVRRAARPPPGRCGRHRLAHRRGHHRQRVPGDAVGHRDFERLSYPVVHSTRDPRRDAHAITVELLHQGPAGFFVTTRGHEAYLELSSGLPAGYGDRLRTELARSPALRVVFAHPDAAVFALRSPPREPPPPLPRPTPLRIDMTAWTPAGAVYLPVLVGMLIARELRRLHQTPPLEARLDRRRLLPNTLLVLPMLAALIAIVADRFLSLG